MIPSHHIGFAYWYLAATAVSSVDDFISTCSGTGQQAKCCVVPVADQALLCQDVSPSS